MRVCIQSGRRNGGGGAGHEQNIQDIRADDVTDRQLAVALVLNSGAGTPFRDLRIIRIGDAAVRCADRR